MKFAICNLGCKVNNYEANWYAQQLSLRYEEVEFKDFADIYIINTCTVTNMAGSKSRQMIRRARKMNPDAVIVAVSCYVQMAYGHHDIFDDCQIVIGSRHKTLLPQYVDQYLQTHERIIDVGAFEVTDFEDMDLQQYHQTRAYLKIQDGCNQFCSFCTIPFARGRERNLSAPQVIEYARNLVEAGHKEIVLTGIHTGRWKDGEDDLTDLIWMLLHHVDGIERIRISSIEMTEISDRLIGLMEQDKRIARHLHIPLQTGTDRMLKLNNRPYTTAQYRNKVEAIRKRMPDISISADVIAGLPTETDQEAIDTEEFIRSCQLSFLHVFPYAKHENTRDAKLKQVQESVKKERAARLTKISHELYNTYRNTLLDKELDVLFETLEEGFYCGHCSQYVEVRVKSDQDLRGRMVRVLIKANKEGYLVGELV